MATLKDVGSEARLLASQLSDRETLRHFSQKLEQLLNQADIELKQLWKAFGATAESWFDNHYSIKRVPLSYVEAMAQKLSRIDSTSQQVFKDPADRPGERLALVKKIIALQYQKKAIESQYELGSAALGSTWRGTLSNWQNIVSDCTWIEKHGDLRFICATVNDRGELLNSANQLSATRVSIINELENLANELESSTDEFFHLDNQHLRIDSVLQKLTSWTENAEQLSKWVAWQHRRNQANNLGLSEVVERLEDGRLPLSTCYSSVEYTYYESLFSLMAKETPSLSASTVNFITEKCSTLPKWIYAV
jgi:exonuclease VII small subunit